MVVAWIPHDRGASGLVLNYKDVGWKKISVLWLVGVAVWVFWVCVYGGVWAYPIGVYGG